MPSRYEPAYKVKRNDNLGDPDFWNKRFQDIDLRLAARELDGERIADAVTQLTSLALQRLNDTFLPLILEAQSRLSNFGVLFTASSASANAVETGEKQFVLSAETRAGWVFVDYVNISRIADPTTQLIGRVLSYDRPSGLVTVDVVLADGAGTHDDWQITVSTKPDVTHATRTDNPHETTAAQVGAYSTAEVDEALAQKAPNHNPHFTGVPEVPTAMLGTNTEQIASCGFVAATIAYILSNNDDVASAVLAALDNRVRFDAGQALTDTQQAQAFGNLGVVSALRTFILADDLPAARAALGFGKASFHANKNTVAQIGVTSGEDTKVDFFNVLFDEGGHYDFEIGRWTPPAGSVLLVAAALPFEGVVAGAQIVTSIRKNGVVAVRSAEYVSADNVVVNKPVVAILAANGTDYFEMYFSMSGAGDKSIDGDPANTYFSGTLL
jgi:hypothetical protein